MTDNAHTIGSVDELNSAARELKAQIEQCEYELPITDEFVKRLLNLPEEWDVQTVKQEWETAIQLAAVLQAACRIALTNLSHRSGIAVIAAIIQVQDIEESAGYFGHVLAEALGKIKGAEQ